MSLNTDFITIPRRSEFLCIALLIGAAVLVRGPWIGNPMPQVDEQFYLLVADRMWHGAIPYVDIWDRKPIGLFLLYALVRPFSEHGIVAYQITAFCFAVGTAYTIMRIGRRIGGVYAAAMAGTLYLIYLPILNGNGGQSPVFYNLFLANAALAIVNAQGLPSQKGMVRPACIAMALVGLAIQIKYTAFVEGVAFGLYLLLLHWRRNAKLGALVGFAAVLVTLAILPTALAIAWFTGHGFGWVFIQANFISIFQAKEPAGVSHVGNLFSSALKMMPMIVMSCISIPVAVRVRPLPNVTVFLLIWGFAAVVDFFIIGRFYGHYALPLLVPLTAIATPLLERPVAAGLIAGSFYFWTGIAPARLSSRIDLERHIDRMVDVLTPYAKDGCIYLKDGPPIVYLLTHSCMPTPFVFPEHLSTILEARATNATSAMAKLIVDRPSAIAISDRVPEHPQNMETRSMLDRALNENYHFKTRVIEPNGTDHQSIYVRNDLD